MKNKFTGGGLFPAQFPGKARRSVFKVFSSIYWETFNKDWQPTTHKIQEGRRQPYRLKIRRQPAPADGLTAGDPEVTILDRKKNREEHLKTQLCV